MVTMYIEHQYCQVHHMKAHDGCKLIATGLGSSLKLTMLLKQVQWKGKRTAAGTFRRLHACDLA